MPPRASTKTRARLSRLSSSLTSSRAIPTCGGVNASLAFRERDVALDAIGAVRAIIYWLVNLRFPGCTVCACVRARTHTHATCRIFLADDDDAWAFCRAEGLPGEPLYTVRTRGQTSSGNTIINKSTGALVLEEISGDSRRERRPRIVRDNFYFARKSTWRSAMDGREFYMSIARDIEQSRRAFIHVSLSFHRARENDLQRTRWERPI